MAVGMRKSAKAKITNVLPYPFESRIHWNRTPRLSMVEITFVWWGS
jgi:hypothetical protein